MIIRTGKPSKYDQLPYGTTCKVPKLMSSQFEIFVQMNHNSENPQWESAGIFAPHSDKLVEEIVDRMLNIKQVR